MSKMSSSYRAAKRGGGDELVSKKLEKSSISNPVNEEMESRKFAFGKDNNDETSQFRSSMRKEYEQKDKDLRNTMDKSLMKSKINYLESRERKLGGKEAVTKKIKTKEKVNKALPWVAGGAVLAGVAKMIYDVKEGQKKIGK